MSPFIYWLSLRLLPAVSITQPSVVRAGTTGTSTGAVAEMNLGESLRDLLGADFSFDRLFLKVGINREGWEASGIDFTAATKNHDATSTRGSGTSSSRLLLLEFDPNDEPGARQLSANATLVRLPMVLVPDEVVASKGSGGRPGTNRFYQKAAYSSVLCPRAAAVLPVGGQLQQQEHGDLDDARPPFFPYPDLGACKRDLLASLDSALAPPALPRNNNASGVPLDGDEELFFGSRISSTSSDEDVVAVAPPSSENSRPAAHHKNYNVGPLGEMNLSYELERNEGFAAYTRQMAYYACRRASRWYATESECEVETALVPSARTLFAQYVDKWGLFAETCGIDANLVQEEDSEFVDAATSCLGVQDPTGYAGTDAYRFLGVRALFDALREFSSASASGAALVAVARIEIDAQGLDVALVAAIASLLATEGGGQGSSTPTGAPGVRVQIDAVELECQDVMRSSERFQQEVGYLYETPTVWADELGGNEVFLSKNDCLLAEQILEPLGYARARFVINACACREYNLEMVQRQTILGSA
ncbi:unnamed protein product [Amoebophrya sp. A120]|nr:unnamed protein product [Amoebophrya sp. A120]|eukprot:GSA120T00015002001.1